MKNALRQSSVAVAASLASGSLAYSLREDSFICAAAVFFVTVVFGFLAAAIGESHD